MNLRTSLIATLSLVGTIALPIHPAVGQTDQQCSLKTVTEALNNLGCIVNGAFVSPDSVVASITETCAATANTETCHACFRKAGGKAGPAFKALAKVKVLPKATLSQFRTALLAAKEATCAPPTNVGGDASESTERGRDNSGGAKPKKPQRPARRR